MFFQAPDNFLPEPSDGLTEQERTGYAAQEFGQSIGEIDYRYRAHGYPFPVNADHTTVYDQYA